MSHSRDSSFAVRVSLILRRCRSRITAVYVLPLVAHPTDACEVAGVRVLVLELLVDRVFLAVDVTLVLGSLAQVIAVVFRRATVALLLVHRLTAEEIVIHQRARAFRLVARLFSRETEDRKDAIKISYVSFRTNGPISGATYRSTTCSGPPIARA